MKTSVTIRKRKYNTDKVSLYLDIYHNGKRRQKTLNLYLFENPIDKFQRQENNNNIEIAQTVRAQYLFELQTGKRKMINSNKSKTDFKEFFKSFVEYKRDEEKVKNIQNYYSVLKLLNLYQPNAIKFEYLDYEWLNGFRNFLNNHTKKNGDPLKQNTKVNYFDKVIAALNKAEKHKYFSDNPTQIIERFDEPDPDRNFLTIEEIRRLNDKHCALNWLKTAFLFGCLSGLRYSDIQSLTWGQIEYSEKIGNFINYKQQKTDNRENHPLSEGAIKILGTRSKPEKKVIPPIPEKLTVTDNQILRKWIAKAKINKYITFHCSRHSYAVMVLSNGEFIPSRNYWGIGALKPPRFTEAIPENL